MSALGPLDEERKSYMVASLLAMAADLAHDLGEPVVAQDWSGRATAWMVRGDELHARARQEKALSALLTPSEDQGAWMGADERENAGEAK